jgi:hypothetical protein
MSQKNPKLQAKPPLPVTLQDAHVILNNCFMYSADADLLTAERDIKHLLYVFC